MTNSTLLVDGFTSTQIADEVNDLFSAGTITTVNGREISSQYGRRPAAAWQNGTVSVSVKGRARGTQGTIFAKVGEELHLA